MNQDSDDENYHIQGVVLTIELVVKILQHYKHYHQKLQL